MYSLPNSISADQACVTDGTVLMNNGQTCGSGNPMSWKTSSQVGVVTDTITKPSKENLIDDTKSTIVEKKRSKKGGNRMVCLFQITDSAKYKGVIFYFDGSDVVKLTHPDQMKVLKDIYKANYGKDMPLFKWTTKAPYYNRLLQVVNANGVKSL